MELMLERPFHIARTSNSFTDELLASHVQATSALCAAVKENLTAETGAQAFRTIYRNAAFLNEGNRVINHKRVAQLTHICEGGKIQLDEPTYRNNCETKKNEIDKAADAIYAEILNESQKVAPSESPRRPELRKLQLESSRIAGDKKNGFHKKIADAIENYSDCVPDRGTVWERLTDTSLLYKHIRLHSEPMVDLAKTAIKTIPSEELVAQFTDKEDTHILVAMLSDESLRENVIGSAPKFDGAVLQQLANLGTLNKMILNTDSYINHGGYDLDPVRLGGKLVPHRNPHVPAWSVTTSDLLPPTLESIHILGAIANKVEVVSPETAPVVEEVVIQEVNKAEPTIEVPVAEVENPKVIKDNPEKVPDEPAKEVAVEEKPAFENVLIDAIKNKTSEPKPEPAPEKPKPHLTKASQQAFAF